MIKTFALIGMICVADPSNEIHKENCFNVWETPRGHYKSVQECDLAGKRLRIMVLKEIRKKNMTLTEGEIWCIETTRGKNP
jgi:hypothetical protein